jgi:putative lipoic acid-binding regulatory protein
VSEDRDRLLALLQAQHTFPGEYYLSVITFTEETIFAALQAAIDEGLARPLDPASCERTASRTGKYTSHRFRVHCLAPEDVLALYDRVRRVTGVVNVL